MPESFTITFTVDKDTKNTRRYAEDTTEAPIIGSLYVQKWAAKKLGGGSSPDHVQVVLTVV